MNVIYVYLTLSLILVNYGYSTKLESKKGFNRGQNIHNIKIRETVTRTPHECIEAINRYDFETASAKLKLIDDEKINYIVKEVYKNQSANFDLVLHFGDSINFSLRKKFLIYKALNDVTENNHHHNPSNQLEIIERLKLKFQKSKKISKNMRKELNLFIYHAEISFITEAKVIIEECILNDIQTKNLLISGIIDKTYHVSRELYEHLLRDTVDILDSDKDIIKLIQFIYLHHSVEQMISVCSIVFDKFQRENKLNSYETIYLVYYIKLTMERKEYDHIEIIIKIMFEKLKERLPVSITTLIFSPAVAIKNVVFNEYLYAESCCRYDADRRKVFTKVKNTGKLCDWKIEFVDNKFYIKNIPYNEYLYAVQDSYAASSSKRYAFTWSKDTRRSQQGSQAHWLFETEGNDFYISSSFVNEYLYAESTKYIQNPGKRAVFTWRDKSWGKFDQTRWKIEAC